MAITKTLILYKPHSIQQDFHKSTARFRIISSGRQVGKSTMCLNELVFRAWEMPGGKFWFVSPIYAQAKAQFRSLVKMLPYQVIEKANESEMRIELINGSDIEFKSGESFDNLRGAALDGVVIDEMRDQKPDLWHMVIRPMIATRKGFAIFASTPSGYDSFYDLFEKAKYDPEWQTFHAASSSAPWWTDTEIESTRASMSDAQFAQEIMAEFRDLHVGKAYLTHGPHNWSIHNPFCRSGLQWAEPLPIVVGLDFNVGSMAWELGQQRGADWYWGDEIWVKNTNTQECAKILVEKVKNHKAGVILCGDATGNARKTSAAGATDYTILAQALTSNRIKWEDRTPAVNPSIKDRVNTVCSKLRSADGSIHMWLNPDQCPHLKTDLQRVSWKQGTNMILDQTTNPELTHASDAIGYPIVAMDPMLQSGAVGTIRILR